jgi:hypothetical protein
MFQLTANTSSTALGKSNINYVNIYDEYTDKSDIQYKPIISLISRATGKIKNLRPFGTWSDDITNKERYVTIRINTTIVRTDASPSFGLIQVGNTDYPFGLYDIIIRENESDILPTDSNVKNYPIVYSGLANLVPTTTGSYANPAVTYTEYTTNDSDTESVYITN